jgi:hypothetical protein
LFALTANSDFGNIFAPNGTMALTNAGVIRQQAATSTLDTGVTVENQASGRIEVLAGTLDIVGALVQNGTLEVESGATLRRIGGFTSAGLVVGGGTIDVGAGNNFISTGTVAPGSETGDPTGTLSITGNYAQGTNGQLNIEVGSTAPDGFDVLAITGSATIANPPFPVLLVELVGGFVPAEGDPALRFMTFASRSGSFAPILPPHLAMQSDATGLELVFTNFAPVAAFDVIDTPEDIESIVLASHFLSNDFDADGDVLAITDVERTTDNGGLVLLEFISLGPIVRYRPSPDFHGTDFFSYTVADGQGGEGFGLVTVTVSPVNDPPFLVFPIDAVRRRGCG